MFCIDFASISISQKPQFQIMLNVPIVNSTAEHNDNGEKTKPKNINNKIYEYVMSERIKVHTSI